jgi:hypothetical protein
LNANAVPRGWQSGDSEFFVFFQRFGLPLPRTQGDRKVTLAGKLTLDGS